MREDRERAEAEERRRWAAPRRPPADARGTAMDEADLRVRSDIEKFRLARGQDRGRREGTALGLHDRARGSLRPPRDPDLRDGPRPDAPAAQPPGRDGEARPAFRERRTRGRRAREQPAGVPRGAAALARAVRRQRGLVLPRAHVPRAAVLLARRRRGAAVGAGLRRRLGRASALPVPRGARTRHSGRRWRPSCAKRERSRARRRTGTPSTPCAGSSPRPGVSIRRR